MAWNRRTVLAICIFITAGAIDCQAAQPFSSADPEQPTLTHPVLQSTATDSHNNYLGILRGVYVRGQYWTIPAYKSDADGEWTIVGSSGIYRLDAIQRLDTSAECESDYGEADREVFEFTPMPALGKPWLAFRNNTPQGEIPKSIRMLAPADPKDFKAISNSIASLTKSEEGLKAPPPVLDATGEADDVWELLHTAFLPPEVKNRGIKVLVVYPGKYMKQELAYYLIRPLPPFDSSKVCLALFTKEGQLLRRSCREWEPDDEQADIRVNEKKFVTLEFPGDTDPALLIYIPEGVVGFYLPGGSGKFEEVPVDFGPYCQGPG